MQELVKSNAVERQLMVTMHTEATETFAHTIARMASGQGSSKKRARSDGCEEDEETTDFEKLKSKLGTTEKDFEKLKSKLGMTEKEVDMLKSKLETTEKEVDTLKSKLGTTEKDFEKLRSKLEKSNEKNSTLTPDQWDEALLLIQGKTHPRKSLDEPGGAAAVTTLELKLRKMEMECTPHNNIIMDDGSLAANLVVVVEAREKEIQRLNDAAVEERRLVGLERVMFNKWSEKCMMLDDKVCLFSFQMFFSKLIIIIIPTTNQIFNLQKEHDHYKKLSESTCDSAGKINQFADMYKGKFENERSINRRLTQNLNDAKRENEQLNIEKSAAAVGGTTTTSTAESERIRIAVIKAVDSVTSSFMAEIRGKESKYDATIKTLNDRYASLVESLYMIDGMTWVDHFKQKFYSLLVVDAETGEPRLTPYTGEVIPKYKMYEQERNEALAELDELKTKMTSKETDVLLERVKFKTRQFKRKYKNLKTYLNDTVYINDFDDKFCDVDKGHDEDSDDDIRLGGGGARRGDETIQHDVGLPYGFAARECVDD